MNEDTFAGQWKQMRGTLKSWWGHLSDDDFEQIGGEKDKLIGKIQEKYGYSREIAQREVERRFSEADSAAAGKLSDAVAAAGELKDKAYEFGASAASKAREARAGVASGFETAGSYLRTNDFENIATDLAGLVRKYPVQSTLIGAGLLYFIARRKHR
jgi:uncharacterized protein YjbJ (UPF0337 family)